MLLHVSALGAQQTLLGRVEGVARAGAGGDAHDGDGFDRPLPHRLARRGPVSSGGEQSAARVPCGANIFGSYLTRDQILRRRPADGADLLYRLGGFTVICHGGTATVFSKRELRKPDPCPANVVIYGVQGRRINDVRPLRIVGLEAYEGPSTFTSDYESTCGLIVIWTSAWRASPGP